MGLLDRVKSDQFDPATMIQEAQDLHRQLYDERTKRKQLEDEIEHVKRGSIAVIKYVRSHEAKEKELALRSKDDEIAELRLRLLALEGAEARSAPSAAPVDGSAPVVAPQYMANAIEKATRELDARLREEFAEREHAYIERETELRRRTVQLESEVRNLRSDSERSRERDELLAAGGSIPAEVDERLQLADQREKDLVTRENELRQRFEEIRINAEEVERRKSPLEFKERELASYDQQLQTRKQALDIEARRLEELRREVGGSGAASASEESRRMEDLKHMLNQKEEELRAREGALRERMITLEAMAGKAAEADAGQMHEDAVRDVAEVKVKTGVRRLDDLLFGGFPAGAQVLVNGPAHTGKDVLARLFSVEGLKLGIPSIWVVTDKTWNQVRDDLIALYPKYEEAEKNGMLRVRRPLLAQRRLLADESRGPAPLGDRQGGARPARPDGQRLLRGAQGEVSDVPGDLRVGVDRDGVPRLDLDVPVPAAVHRPPEDRPRRRLLHPRPRDALGRRLGNPRAHGRRLGEPEDRTAEDVPRGEGDRRGPIARLDRLHVHQALAQPGLVQLGPHPLGAAPGSNATRKNPGRVPPIRDRCPRMEPGERTEQIVFLVAGASVLVLIVLFVLFSTTGT